MYIKYSPSKRQGLLQVRSSLGEPNFGSTWCHN